MRTQLVSRLLTAAPGIDTLTSLSAINPFDLPAAARIDYLSALERQISWLQAMMQRAIVAVAGEEGSKSDDIFTGVDDAEREDVAAALRMSTGTAQIRIDVARTLVNHLPNVCSALAMGEISPAHATVIARESASAIRDGMGPAHIYSIEQSALAYAEFHTPTQVANKVRTTIAKLAPEPFEEIAERARDTRRVSCFREVDGLSTIVAILPAEDAQIVMKAIENFIHAQVANEAITLNARGMSGAGAGAGVAGAGVGVGGAGVGGASDSANDSEVAPGEHRSMDMKRADALTSIATWSLQQSTVDVKLHRRPVTVNVTIDLPTLLGLAENPGQLAGYGAIPASVARALASDGKWQRFITDPQTGTLLDFGRESYEPPQALIDFLIARDRTCRFPGCRHSAARADLDHAQSWESGGKTSPENLGALCRRHHRLKTHGGWKLKSHSDGACTWTSPLGKIYEVPARPMLEAI
ncbi:unannotated protein [freshwater metagenome]|jgi:hypothetical protein|uniref:Unannotated protein n=1 Tax=freshwater metagenome TaxID=449393 RepID=A0A6J6IRU8_9ZZZZ|nr:DUF222 domain-containing protein [Actinomycetota bacterium]